MSMHPTAWDGQSQQMAGFHLTPCAGTATHSTRTYWEDKLLSVFDILLVVTDDRVTALDIELVHIATKVYKKPVAIVKNKGDNHIIALRRDQSMARAEAETYLIEGFQKNVQGKRSCRAHVTPNPNGA